MNTKPYVITKISRGDAYYCDRKKYIGKRVSERMMEKMTHRSRNFYYGPMFNGYFYGVKIEKAK